MPYQSIHDTIAVAGVYKSGKFWPRKFSWRGRVYHIAEITIMADHNEGQVKKRQYSVVTTGHQEVFRLLFDRHTEQWLLAEIWLE